MAANRIVDSLQDLINQGDSSLANVDGVSASLLQGRPLAAPNPSQGQSLVWSDSQQAWIAATVAGQIGPQGPVGPPGPQGLMGLSGNTGATGLRGTPGVPSLSTFLAVSPLSYDIGSGTLSLSSTGILQSTHNLSDLTNVSTARSNLGLGTASVLNVGTSTGTVADAGVVATSLAAKLGPSDSGSGLTNLNASSLTAGTVPIGVLPTGTTATTVALGNDSRITGAAQAANNLSDLASASTARTNLGLGGASTLNVGTVAGTVPDAGAVATSLAGKLSTTGNGSALTNLNASSLTAGTVPIAFLPTGTTATSVALGNDSRITGAAQAANNLSDLASASTARTNLGLGGASTLNVGTVAGTVADAGAVATSLAGKLSTTGNGSALTNLNASSLTGGTVPIAALPTGTTATTVALGNDSRITGAAQAANNLSDLAKASTARTNLGLGGASTLNVGTVAGTVADAGAVATSLAVNVAYVVVHALSDFATAIASSNVVISVAQNASISITTAITCTSSNITISGPGKIIFTSAGSLSFSGCTNPILDGAVFVGALSSQIQFTPLVQGSTIGSVATAMGSPTFNDGAGNSLSGSDFTHTLSGSLMTMSLGGAFGNTLTTRNVMSALIPLTSTNRYMIDILPGFYTGDGGNRPVFTLYNSSSAKIGVYDPSDSSTFFSVIQNAAYISIQVGVTSWYSTALNLSCTVDFSKINFYQCVNDLATVSLASSVGDITHILFGNCTSPVIRNCKFSMMAVSCAKFVNCLNPVIERNDSTYCYGGFSTQTGTGVARFAYNHVDMRVGLTGGGLIGQRVLRQRAYASTADPDLTCYANLLIGASWAVEVIANNSAYRHEVTHNDITAEYCGISECAAGGTAPFPSIVSHNQVKVSTTAIHGIEMSGSSSVNQGSECAFNNIKFADLFYSGVGIIQSSSLSFIRVSNNVIYAPVAISISTPTTTSTAEVYDNKIWHGSIGIYLAGFTASIYNNTIRVVYNTWGFGVAQAAIYVDCQAYFYFTRVFKNTYDGTVTFAGYMGNSTRFDWSNNHVSAYPSTAVDIHRIAVPSQAYAALCRFSGNVIRTDAFLAAGLNRVVNSTYGAFYTGSRLLASGNTANDIPFDTITGYGATAQCRGITATVTWNPGAIGNGTSAVSTAISLPYGLFKIGDPVRVLAPYDLQGLTATAYIKTAAAIVYSASYYSSMTPATAVIVLTNNTGSAVTLASGTWTVVADQVL